MAEMSLAREAAPRCRVQSGSCSPCGVSEKGCVKRASTFKLPTGKAVKTDLSSSPRSLGLRSNRCPPLHALEAPARALLTEDLPSKLGVGEREDEQLSLEELFLRQASLYGEAPVSSSSEEPGFTLTVPLGDFASSASLEAQSAALPSGEATSKVSAKNCNGEITRSTVSLHAAEAGEALLSNRIVQPQPGQALQAVLQSEVPPATQNDRGLGDDYHVNVGYAIRTLRDELPTMFYKEMSYDIYRDDITFQDPLNTFYGLKSYKTIFWALRFHGGIFFKGLWVDVNRVWQPDDRTIVIRWSVRGVPRVPWEARGRFDGTSTYKLDKNGKIFAHKVDNVALSDPPKYRALTVMELLQLSGAQQTPGITCYNMLLEAAGGLRQMLGRWCAQEPHKAQVRTTSRTTGAVTAEQCRSVKVENVAALCPGSGASEFGASVSSGSSSTGLSPAPLELGSVTWFRFYLALAGTLALRDDIDFAARALLLA